MASPAPSATYLAGRVLVVVVPELCFQDLGWHGFDILLGVVFGDGSEYKEAFTN